MDFSWTPEQEALRAQAREVAADNGGELVGFVTEGGEVEVTVRVGESEAVARARPSW